MPVTKKSVKDKPKTVKKQKEQKALSKKKVSTKSNQAAPSSKAKKKISSRIAVVDTTPEIARIPVTKAKLELALLSPFKFQIDPHRLATQTARYSGIFFVVAGAIFTLINIQTLNSLYAELENTDIVAQATAATDFCNTNLTNYDSELCSTLDETASVPEHPVAIDFSATNAELSSVNEESNGLTKLTGQIDVILEVDDAEKVDVYVRPPGTSGVKLGSAVSTGANRWIYRWNTKQINDGEYSLYSLIRNNAGHEYENGEKSVVIRNNLGSTETVNATNESQITLNFEKSGRLNEDSYLYIYADSLDSVSVYIDDIYAGEGDFASNEKWRYLLKVDTYSDGEHELYVKGTSSDESTLESGTVLFLIDNEEEFNTSEGATEAVLTVDEDTTGNEDPVGLNESDSILKPEVKLHISSVSPLKGIVELSVEAEGAQFVELYAVPRYALKELFLGIASRTGTDKWSLRWNTIDSPNGEYNVFARVKNTYGVYDSKKLLMSIYNEVQTTAIKPEDEQTKRVADLKEIVDPILNEDENQLEEIQRDKNEESLFSSDDRQKIQEGYDRLLELFQSEIDEEMQRLRSAIRSVDRDAVNRVRERIDNLKERIRLAVLSENMESELLDALDRRFNDAIARIEQNTEQSESLITERIGEAVTSDTDQDGVTDYDEVNIYKTNPLVADSDGDGFVDGAEILNGYNPNDNTPETLVSYESPKEFGVVRDDYLKVDSIASDNVENKPAAVIRGKALPNSFITIYIFSTPIIVTVKTNDDGSWSYRFDKELEDGSHEVYVGITDNSGRIIAKSNPLPFVKTAEAFTPVDATAGGGVVVPTDNKTDSLFTDNIILIILSLAVVALGLVLMLLGVYLQTRKPVVQLSPV